ncbi:MAG: AAA family ATPase [Alloprevotella sp.]|nr:AAA family ATPase [Bacteroidales bacterium]MDY3942829.1 AAA family ATPase [Alloprevotella sp.]
MQYAHHITRIEIDSLWMGKKHIVWTLQPDVNVLSGKNGVGKSTILNRLVARLQKQSNKTLLAEPIDGVRIELSPVGATAIRCDVLRSFDTHLRPSDRLSGLSNGEVTTELDWQLYQLQRRYLDYQVNVANRIIALMAQGGEEAQRAAQEEAATKMEFLDIVDRLFEETGKTIDRTSNELLFRQYGQSLSPYCLSAGEKQMLIILLTVLTQDRQPTVLFMDEPEASLHFDWQRDLISIIRRLNPQAQIILTTHSPAVIMNGWENNVTEVGEITL